jgi:ATP-binding cassette subfamily B protein
VPQSIFLADSSIYENIAFGTPKENICHEKVKVAASKANISSLIESWPEQYNTLIGERGTRLSGGQKQRIGIARALYKGAKIIIFDEATSALDDNTENIVMESINSLDPDLTLIIIAHRTSTLSSCDKIYRIVDKRIIEEDIPHKM